MDGVGEPYLSVVVTARNDDHGGNLLDRMQVFVAGWIEQARRFHIPSELIIVEWNPPPDRPRLIDALRWPVDLGCCEVRFIEVPPELHARYPHGGVLPLYQMAAKNAGIRRARGQFVLATNIDILFSDELAEYLAARRLERGRMYRIDRHDAMSDVPPDAPVEEQLAYCATHLLRVNRREGSFNVSSEGHPALSANDVAPDGSGISFGRGWYPPECHVPPDFFRWAGDVAEIHLEAPSEPGLALVLDIEPGPSTGGLPLQLEIEVDGEGRVRAGWRLRLGGGYTGMPKHARNLSLRTVLMIAGGPTANVWTFLLCQHLLRTEAATQTGIAFAFVRGLMIFSLFSAVVNLAPVQFGSSRTDGRRMWDALWRFIETSGGVNARPNSSRRLA